MTAALRDAFFPTDPRRRSTAARDGRPIDTRGRRWRRSRPVVVPRPPNRRRSAVAERAAGSTERRLRSVPTRGSAADRGDPEVRSAPTRSVVRDGSGASGPSAPPGFRQTTLTESRRGGRSRPCEQPPGSDTASVPPTSSALDAPPSSARRTSSSRAGSPFRPVRHRPTSRSPTSRSPRSTPRLPAATTDRRSAARLRRARNRRARRHAGRPPQPDAVEHPCVGRLTRP